jgi:hypothetical protein
MDLFTHGNRNRAYMDKQAALVRDEFNLNKILIVVTSVGKVNIYSRDKKLIYYSFVFQRSLVF